MSFANTRSILFVLICLSPFFPSQAQNEVSYEKAFSYIFKSKEIDAFRDTVRREQGIIVKSIIASDSVSKNNPYPFLCAILKRKTKSQVNCSQLIGSDRLSTYDSIRQEYKQYSFSGNYKLPFHSKRSKGRKAFVLTFSEPFKKTVSAEIHYRSSPSIQFYFVFGQNSKIKKVFIAYIRN